MISRECFQVVFFEVRFFTQEKQCGNMYSLGNFANIVKISIFLSSFAHTRSLPDATRLPVSNESFPCSIPTTVGMGLLAQWDSGASAEGWVVVVVVVVGGELILLCVEFGLSFLCDVSALSEAARVDVTDIGSSVISYVLIVRRCCTSPICRCPEKKLKNKNCN